MPSWQNRLAGVVLRVLFRRRTADEHTMRRNVHAAMLRPGRYGPPRSFDRTTKLSIEMLDGWPVYTVAPLTGSVRVRVLYLHGGSYLSQIAREHWLLIRQIARDVPAEVDVPIYPLAPTATAEHIVAGAAALLARMLERHGADDLVLMGDSAGGGMALAVAQALRDQGLPQPSRIVLISPWLDVTMRDPRQSAIEPTDPWLNPKRLVQAGRLYAGALAVTDPRVSPLYGRLDGLAPITIFIGTRDILRTDADTLTDNARRSGVQLTRHDGYGLFHVYPLLPTPEGKAARELIVQACQQAHT